MAVMVVREVAELEVAELEAAVREAAAVPAERCSAYFRPVIVCHTRRNHA